MNNANKTYAAKPLEVKREWLVIDAKGKTLGRLSSEVARLLRGKHKPQFTPNIDTGDFIIVLNAKDINFTGKKGRQKEYRRYTGYPGGLRSITLNDQLQKAPEKVIEHAVWGMLPHNSLGRDQIRKLHVYAGTEHPHAAQQPKAYEWN